ncbi:hypothetical protein AVEN_17719-1 [Araneus ventricosus]|uniref:Uncharacterized protein n=1 Tax=Araneus ventricosus TaxID=182803 RepID=A0A4Y2F9U2_ARAVE|nr:hypothetical protein AVEN_17719-1 [Araneus ventricosus]
MNFEPFYSKKVEDSEESLDAEAEEQPTRRRIIKLASNTKMVIRNFPAVVRVPFFQIQTDPENYFYSLLVQYVPFYLEDELIDEHNNAREAFLAREEQLRKTNAYLEIHRARDRQLETAFNQAHSFDLLENPEEIAEAELKFSTCLCHNLIKMFKDDCKISHTQD